MQAIKMAAKVDFQITNFEYYELIRQGLTDKTSDQMLKAMPRAIAVDAVGSLLMAFILEHAVVYAQATSLLQGAAVGALNWLGFVAVVLVATNVYEQRPLRSAYVSAGFNLVALVLMGALFAVWR